MEGFPKLVVRAGPEEGQDYLLSEEDVYRFGRSPDNQFVLLDSSVSRRHAAITTKAGQCFLQDLESHNGTLVNGRKIDTESQKELKHLDEIEIGIYRLQFLERPFAESDLEKKKELETTPLPVDEKKSAVKKTEHEEVESLLGDLIEDQRHQEKIITDKQQVQKKSRWLLTLILLVIGLGGMGYAYWHYFARDSKQKLPQEEVKVLVDDSKEVPPEAPEPETPIEVKKPPEVLTDSSKKTFPLFIDIQTKPFPATLYFRGERLGIAPLKTNIEVTVGATYEIFADFEMRDIGDIYRKRVEFEVKPDTDVIELDVQAEIGVLKILKLPRDAQFYLEGFYAYDKLKSKPVKISDIVYGKPIYLPYGDYKVELRGEESISGSQNKISQIKYQREYTINEQNPALEINVTDKDFRIFPISIKSDPTGADLFYNDEGLGKTPYNGNLPIGKGVLQVSKEGYFTEKIEIDMRFNSVYQKLIELNTSKVGEMINAAKDKIRDGKNEEAIETLVEALKYGGGPKEKAEVYFVLGQAYFLTKQFEKAIPYFEKAKTHETFAIKASLGLARTYHFMEQHDKAMSETVQVLMALTRETPAEIRGEANALFKKISPIKSVVFISTEPPGADVFLNDKKLELPTPVIIPELGLGTYRVEIQKLGFENYKTKQVLKLGEFVQIKVRLIREQ